MNNDMAYPPPQYIPLYPLSAAPNYVMARPLADGHFMAPIQAPMARDATTQQQRFGPPHTTPTAPPAAAQSAAPAHSVPPTLNPPAHSAAPPLNPPSTGAGPDIVSCRLLGNVNRSLLELIQVAHSQRIVLERLLMTVSVNQMSGRGGHGRRGNGRYRKKAKGSGNSFPSQKQGTVGGARPSRFQEATENPGPIGLVEKHTLGNGSGNEPAVAAVLPESDSNAASSSASST
ncbi:hypothetical protein niasHS_008373 [Heterodera schachtii]|uniref:Uncharacterized protein n=1 Tax=Heterodera schachtii TaxID=97005 RepID=A0ABD2J849_HETSC